MAARTHGVELGEDAMVLGGSRPGQGVNVYFDIDGVLNLYGPDPLSQTPDDQDLWSSYRSQSMMLTYSPEMIARINEILAIPGVTPFWLTTWEREAAWFGSQVGLTGAEEWQWLPAVGMTPSGQWQKFASIRSHLKVARPQLAIWFDDDLAIQSDARAWTDRLGAVHAHAPDPRIGLRPSEVDRMEELIRSQTSSR
ncbi:HAD domain-containing protein [Acidipropionibacterium jensenii]|uniref:HAD domain-containing protein n=1 Tax=Acidipropionibacterium jensenii TaxID=1749 RepID=UPI00214C6783|nr:HAD domain-containing protein [Acidipropionibacterium jensenii]